MVAKTGALIERKRILRVLIVDQNVDDVRRVRELLQTGGDFVTHAARTVDEARALLEDGCSMSRSWIRTWTSEGNELAQHLRERRNDVAVVLLTNGENEREALPALKLGAHDSSEGTLEDGQQS